MEYDVLELCELRVRPAVGERPALVPCGVAPQLAVVSEELDRVGPDSSSAVGRPVVDEPAVHHLDTPRERSREATAPVGGVVAQCAVGHAQERVGREDPAAVGSGRAPP